MKISKPQPHSSLIISIILLLVLSSCNRGGESRRVLAEADSLAEINPDSSMTLLRHDSAIINSIGIDERMWYAMSRTEVEDNLYIPHRSDSVMQRVVAFYKLTGTTLQRVRSNYLLGRVLYDIHLYASALSAFEKALRGGKDKAPAVCHYKALACEWIGRIYEDYRLHRQSLKYNERALAYARHSKYSSDIVYALRGIGRSYKETGDTAKAIAYYKRSMEKAQSIKDRRLYNMVAEELAGGIYCNEKMYAEARQILISPFYNEGNRKDISSHFLTWANLYKGTGNADSAIICFKKVLEHGTGEDRYAASAALAQLYKDKGDIDRTLYYYDLSLRYNDSVRQEEKAEHEDFIRYVGENSINEREKAELAESRVRLIIAISIVTVFLVLSVIYFLSWRKHTKAVYAEQRKRAIEQWEKTHKDDLENIRKHKEAIEKLKAELSDSNESNDDLRIKLIDLERDLEEKNRQMQLEKKNFEQMITNFEHSELYKKFHKTGFAPGKDDFNRLEEALNCVYERFTFRLRELYPDIQTDEIQICCLIKIGLKSKAICYMMGIQPNVLSMKRLRLYSKFFNRKGSAYKFDTFIREA